MPVVATGWQNPPHIDGKSVIFAHIIRVSSHERHGVPNHKNKENVNAQHHWSFLGEFLGNQFPSQRACNTEDVFIIMTSRPVPTCHSERSAYDAGSAAGGRRTSVEVPFCHEPLSPWSSPPSWGGVYSKSINPLLGINVLHDYSKWHVIVNMSESNRRGMLYMHQRRHIPNTDPMGQDFLHEPYPGSYTIPRRVPSSISLGTDDNLISSCCQLNDICLVRLLFRSYHLKLSL